MGLNGTSLSKDGAGRPQLATEVYGFQTHFSLLVSCHTQVRPTLAASSSLERDASQSRTSVTALAVFPCPYRSWPARTGICSP